MELQHHNFMICYRLDFNCGNSTSVLQPQALPQAGNSQDPNSYTAINCCASLSNLAVRERVCRYRQFAESQCHYRDAGGPNNVYPRADPRQVTDGATPVRQAHQ